MSLDGHVLWKRIVVGPCCPFAIIGKPSAAAPVVTPPTAFKKRRRLPVDACLRDFLPLLLIFRVMRCSSDFFCARRRRWAMFVACYKPGDWSTGESHAAIRLKLKHYRHRVAPCPKGSQIVVTNDAGRFATVKRKDGSSGGDGAPLAQRLGKRAGVDILELASDGHAARETCHAQIAR